MIRITINWDFISPALQTISGVAIIEDVDPTYNTEAKELIRFKVKKEPGVTSYESIDDEGILSGIFDQIKHDLDTMIDSYYYGFKLSKMMFNWLENRNVKLDGNDDSQNIIECREGTAKSYLRVKGKKHGK